MRIPTQTTELHCHYSGSIPYHTLFEILKTNNPEIDMPDVSAVEKAVSCPSKLKTFDEFLRKFDIFNKIKWNLWAVNKSIDGFVEYQARTGIKYVEVSIGFDKYLSNHIDWDRPTAISYIANRLKEVGQQFGVVVRVLMAVKMESPANIINDSLAIINTSASSDVIGIDLVGDERKLNFYDYIDRLVPWRGSGKIVVGHFGETCPSHNIKMAIEKLKVSRIRHANSIVDDISLIKLAIDNNVSFDISLHSNYILNTVSDMSKHHLKLLLEHGASVTLGTDDPTVFKCSLADEYNSAIYLGLLGHNQNQIYNAVASMQACADRIKSTNISR